MNVQTKTVLSYSVLSLQQIQYRLLNHVLRLIQTLVTASRRRPSEIKIVGSRHYEQTSRLVNGLVRKLINLGSLKSRNRRKNETPQHQHRSTVADIRFGQKM